MNKKRLLNVARALREAPVEVAEKFTMRWFGFRSEEKCGTPACALGHYAVRSDLQELLYLNKYGNLRLKEQENGPEHDDMYIDSAPVLEHFEITRDEADQLFGHHGCDDARTAIEAALFIENFVNMTPTDDRS